MFLLWCNARFELPILSFGCSTSFKIAGAELFPVPKGLIWWIAYTWSFLSPSNFRHLARSDRPDRFLPRSSTGAKPCVIINTQNAATTDCRHRTSLPNSRSISNRESSVVHAFSGLDGRALNGVHPAVCQASSPDPRRRTLMRARVKVRLPDGTHALSQFGLHQRFACVAVLPLGIELPPSPSLERQSVQETLQDWTLDQKNDVNWRSPGLASSSVHQQFAVYFGGRRRWQQRWWGASAWYLCVQNVYCGCQMNYDACRTRYKAIVVHCRSIDVGTSWWRLAFAALVRSHSRLVQKPHPSRTRPHGMRVRWKQS